jgi:hypothetical protein
MSLRKENTILIFELVLAIMFNLSKYSDPLFLVLPKNELWPFGIRWSEMKKWSSTSRGSLLIKKFI